MATVSIIPSGRKTKTPSGELEVGRQREHQRAKGTDIVPLLAEYPPALVLAGNGGILGARVVGYLAGEGMCTGEKEDRTLTSFA